MYKNKNGKKPAKKAGNDEDENENGNHSMKEAMETPAAKTLETHDSGDTGYSSDDTMPQSKAGAMASVMGAMSKMSPQDLNGFMQMFMNSKQLAAAIPDDAAARNAASIAAKGAMKEDVAELFGSEELSEEFKEKTTILFEAAVSARVIAETARIEEEYQQKLEEEVAQVTEALSDQIDDYLTYAAGQWMKENEVAIESSLRNELSEEFIRGLRNLFAEHYITFPEEEVDAVEALAEKVDSLEEKLNEQIRNNMELVSLVEQYNKHDVFNEVSEGLALTQIDKFKTLAEGVDFENDATVYKRKLEVIKEQYFGVKSKPSMLNEEVDVDTPNNDKPFLEPQIASYAQAISRTIKK